MISEKRLKELDNNILRSMGWNANESQQEKKEIMRKWNKMSGQSSYHDAIKELIREKQGSKAGCPRSYSGEHAFETYGVPKGKMRCVHCGIIKSVKRAR
jgi:hypothetical protein